MAVIRRSEEVGLRHLRDVESRLSSTTYHFQVGRVTLIRPPDRKRSTRRPVTCATCGESVTIRILSIAAARRRRRLLLIVGLLGLAIGSVTAMATGMPAWMLLGIAFAGLLAWISWADKGCSIVPRRVFGPHSLDTS